VEVATVKMFLVLHEVCHKKRSRLDELETLKKNGNPTIHEFVEEHAYFSGSP